MCVGMCVGEGEREIAEGDWGSRSVVLWIEKLLTHTRMCRPHSSTRQ